MIVCSGDIKAVQETIGIKNQQDSISEWCRILYLYYNMANFGERQHKGLDHEFVETF